jgi:hypothetical protein
MARSLDTRPSGRAAALSPPRQLLALRDGFTRSAQAPGALRRWLLAVVLLGMVYAGAIALLGIGGGVPGSTPWLAIPSASYFLVEAAFTMPVVAGATLLAASTAYLLARALGSRGDYDTTLVTIARATCIATLCSLVPDLFMGLTTAVGVFDGGQVSAELIRPSGWRTFLWIYLTAYLLAFLVLYPTAVSASHPRLRARAATVVGVAAFAVYQGVLLVFIR